MLRARVLLLGGATSFIIGFGAVVPALSGQNGPSNPVSAGTTNGEWPTYTGDLRGSRYSPADQINATNFNKLEVAWRFKTESLGPRPEYKLEGTPLMVAGVLYATAGTRRAVVALDASTGELLWVHGEREGPRGAAAPRQLSGRGLAYWSDGSESRILYVTPGYRLVALDSKTGVPAHGFGENGIVDLKQDVVYGADTPIDLVTGEIGLHSTPVVTQDLVIVGSAFKEGYTPKTHNNTKGLVRAFDARTGKKVWQFNTIPKPGQPGAETWLGDSWAVNGNTGVWSQITVDEELGLVYLPVESPTGDFYGGHRPGANLYGESLVCVDLKSGQRKWHYQLVHHPLWDMDISSAPILADITVDGRAIKAVAQPSKQGFLYVFDRVTGQPVWPIEERPVEKGSVPGEWYSPTQPIPTKPPAYSRNGVTVDDLIDFTPELRAEAVKKASKYKLGPVFTPPVLSKREGPLATLTLGTASGGTNWPGASYDPETHVVYAPAADAALDPIGLVPPPNNDFSDMNYVWGSATRRIVMMNAAGAGAGADAVAQQPAAAPSNSGEDEGEYANLTIQNLPLIKPPYGRISAISLDRGELLWQVPHGETPDSVRNHPALKGLTIPKTGQAASVGALVTKTLVIAGDGEVTRTATRPRGAMLRAYDKATGAEVGAVYMPAPQSGSPMTYMLNGKQFIVVAVSGGPYPGEYLAFSLPSTVPSR